ncbi:MAG TPA: hypothetical protein VMZ52_16385 [Bryobacteraceae bacterium]|nr:hypothetical protein [Bryobacteraceae bacterium]
MPEKSISELQDSITPEDAQDELQAVLRSPTFQRSERLQRFLQYICEMTLRGEGCKINEYLIGSEVFQRGPAYSPSEDSIVRRQAHSLRQKLHEYYLGEGKEHSVRIELPVGRYVPAFRRLREEPPPALVQPAPIVEQPVSVPEPRPFSGLGAWILAGCLLFLAGAFIGTFVWERVAGGPKSGVSSVVREVWGPWLAANHEAILCFSNPMTTVVKYFDKPLPPDSVPPRHLVHPSHEKSLRDTFHLPPGGFLYSDPAINQTKIGEAIAAVYLTALLTRGGVSVLTTQSRFVSWEDVKKGNLILLGHSEANQWIDPLLKKYPFRLTTTNEARQRSIVNTHPAAGEQAEYQIAYSSGDTEGDQEYALISMIPGLEGGRELLLVSGLNAQATQIATEYITREDTLGQLLSRLKQSSQGHTGPWHFQAVLKTEVHDKVPVTATLVTVRAL